jgi:hypothetical protein
MMLRMCRCAVGGAVRCGGVQVDPEAARMVFESGVHVVMVPLEVRGFCLGSWQLTCLFAPPPSHTHSNVGRSPRVCLCLRRHEQLILIGWCVQVTHTVLVTKDVFARIAALDSPFSRLIEGLLGFFADTYRE